MNLGPSLLDRPETHDQLAQALAGNQERPFTSRLEEFLEQVWSSARWQPAPPTDDRQCPAATTARHLAAADGQWAAAERSLPAPLVIWGSVLTLMARTEDVPLILRMADHHGQHLAAFYLLWRSGLFAEARTLLDERKEIRSQVGFDYLEQDGHHFCVAAEFAAHGVWGQSADMLQSMVVLASCASELRWDVPGTPFGRQPPRSVSGHSARRALIITGPCGTEKPEVARAVHALSARTSYGTLDCTRLPQAPLQEIENCQHEGTVFLEHFDKLDGQSRPRILQAINEQRLLLTLQGAHGPFNEYLPLDTFFVLGVEKKLRMVGWLPEPSPLGVLGRAEPLCPLSRRTDDIPLLVNQLLLAHGQTRLDPVRHIVAANVAAKYRSGIHVGHMAWLRAEVGRWVREFSPPPFCLEPDGHTVAWHGTRICLTPNQYSVVSALWHNPDHEMTEQQLLVKALGKARDANGRAPGRLLDSFRNTTLYGSEGDHDALVVKVRKSRPLRVRLNV